MTKTLKIAKRIKKSLRGMKVFYQDKPIAEIVEHDRTEGQVKIDLYENTEEVQAIMDNPKHRVGLRYFGKGIVYLVYSIEILQDILPEITGWGSLFENKRKTAVYEYARHDVSGMSTEQRKNLTEAINKVETEFANDLKFSRHFILAKYMAKIIFPETKEADIKDFTDTINWLCKENLINKWAYYDLVCFPSDNGKVVYAFYCFSELNNETLNELLRSRFKCKFYNEGETVNQ